MIFLLNPEVLSGKKKIRQLKYYSIDFLIIFIISANAVFYGTLITACYGMISTTAYRLKVTSHYVSLFRILKTILKKEGALLNDPIFFSSAGLSPYLLKADVDQLIAAIGDQKVIIWNTNDDHPNYNWENSILIEFGRRKMNLEHLGWSSVSWQTAFFYWDFPNPSLKNAHLYIQPVNATSFPFTSCRLKLQTLQYRLVQCN